MLHLSEHLPQETKATLNNGVVLDAMLGFDESSNNLGFEVLATWRTCCFIELISFSGILI
jgi:hypothetical protein